MKYFEVIFEDEGFRTSSMCTRGIRVPTVEEANQFYTADVELYGFPVIDVRELDEGTAREEFDFDNEANWPIFGEVRL